MTTLKVDINMDKKCHECGKSGAMKSSICMRCASKALSSKPMKSDAGKMVQERFNKIKWR